MGAMKNIDIEIKNSPALSYLWHEIQQLRKEFRLRFPKQEIFKDAEDRHEFCAEIHKQLKTAYEWGDKVVISDQTALIKLIQILEDDQYG